MIQIFFNLEKRKKRQMCDRLKKKLNIHVKIMFILQPINAVSHFDNACGNLFLWMAIYDVSASINTCYVGVVLYFFTNFIS